MNSIKNPNTVNSTNPQKLLTQEFKEENCKTKQERMELNKQMIEI